MKAKKSNVISPICFNYQNSDESFDNYIKANSSWTKFKNKYKIPNKYITDENKEHFIYLILSGIDAEQIFLNKIKELDNICKK